MMTEEQQVQQFRVAILKLAGKHNLDSAIIAMAVADVLADIASTSDRLHGQQNLDARLDAFCKRVTQTYVRVKTLKETKKDGQPRPAIAVSGS